MVLPVLNRVSNQLLEVEIARHLETKSEDTLYKCAQTLFSQFARTGFLLNGKKRIFASTVCVLCANKNIYLSDGVNKILDIAEVLFAVHSLFYTSALYGASFLVMRFVSHIADCDSNNPSAVKIKLVFVGYFPSLSKLFLSRGLEQVARTVNTLFLAKIIADYRADRRLQAINANKSKEPIIQVKRLFELPITPEYADLRKLVGSKLSSATKSHLESSPMSHLRYHIQGGDETPGLLALKYASYGVVSDSIGEYLLDPYIVGVSMRGKYNFLSGYIDTHFSYSNKMVAKIVEPKTSKHYLRKAVESVVNQIIKPIKALYAYFGHLIQRLENVLRAYFLEGDMSSIKERLIELCLALFCFNEVVQKKQEMSALTVEDLTKASGKSVEELTALGILV
jgi:hypothetical protein